MDFLRTYHKDDKSKLGLKPAEMRKILVDAIAKFTPQQVKDMEESWNEIGDSDELKHWSESEDHNLDEGTQKRPISEIAREAVEDMKKQSPDGQWKRKFAAAEAYLTHMLSLDKITDKYYEDSASGIVAYFLGNA